MLVSLTRRRVVRVLAILIAVVLMPLAAWVAVAGPVTVQRIVRYGDTDIDDYSHYPGRPLSPSPSSFSFARSVEAIDIPRSVLDQYDPGNDLGAMLEANNTTAFLVIKSDTVLYERYYQGHTPSSISQVFSVTKSFTSALIGMAIEDGYIAGVDQPITDFIPELTDAGFTNVTIHHLLTMMSGSSYQENDNPFGEHVILNFTPQLEEVILGFGMESPPGTVFRYKSGDNALLGLALARALGPETITQYAQRRLWTPIGMQDRAVWTIDHEGNGLEKTWCCLATSARDLAKLGRLYLNHGAWVEGYPIPSTWPEQSTRAHVPEAEWSSEYQSIGWRNYGYQWWLASEDDGDYFALGKDGQFLYVNPAAKAIIVRLGWSTGDLLSSQWISLFQAISRTIR